MAYLIAGLIVGAFLAVYLLLKPKIREEYSKTLSVGEYFDLSYQFAKSLPLTKKKGADLKAEYYLSAIKSSLRILKRKRFAEKFACVVKMESAIKTLTKLDFSTLCDLPSVDGVPRVVKIAEFCLKSNGYKFSGERIATIINNQNRVRTLSFDEILAFDKAFYFATVKKIAFLLEECKTVCKMMDLARKYLKGKDDFATRKDFKAIKDNKLFLSFCADFSKYESDECENAQKLFFDRIQTTLERIFVLEKNIEKIDFSAFYAPLRILGSYESFDEASREEKIEFLKLLKSICEKENIDEYLFAIRLDSFMHTKSAGHIYAARTSLFGKKISVVAAKKDITALSTALTSNVMMSLLFGGANVKNCAKSIIKIGKIENTFEQISKFKALNFGVSIQNDRLKIKPHLPKNIENVNFQISHKGVLHFVSIERGDERRLYLDDTKLTGTSEIYLKDKPLKIKLIVPC